VLANSSFEDAAFGKKKYNKFDWISGTIARFTSVVLGKFEV